MGLGGVESDPRPDFRAHRMQITESGTVRVALRRRVHLEGWCDGVMVWWSDGVTVWWSDGVIVSPCTLIRDLISELTAAAFLVRQIFA